MCRYDNSFSLLIELEEEVHNLVRIVGIEIPCRLVTDNNLGIMDECARDRDPLSFSSGEGFDEAFFFVEESDSREDFGDFFEDVGILVSAHFHRKRDVFSDSF